ncbi:glycosyltransferase family A protein [Microbacterium schleiferi]|uniref:glycosyltransferase family 2 protein n=1 Tax=Microbacterium schleiferi TaxID=69362 RepID=UPI00311DCEE2
MNSLPRVSVVVRTKDRPRFLRRALDSILAQSFVDWEAIIVNDGGDQVSLDQMIAALPEAQRPRIRVISNPVSLGRWRSANAGVRAAHGEFLVLHDDDDTWHPDFLRQAVAYLDAHPTRDGVVARTEILWERRGEDEAFHVDAREVFQPRIHDLLLSDALLFNRFVPIGFVYRRSLHDVIGLYSDDLPVIGDWAFNLQVLTRGPIHFLGSEPLAYWHQRIQETGTDGNSVIESRSSHARYDALIRDAELRRYVNENGLGLVLYLTKFIDQRFVDVENGIRNEIVASSLWRRLSRRVRRLRRSR